MSTRNSKKGFTLIELVIVLAIAALIIVGILLAVNGAQKSRRDSQRKSDLARVLANVETWESNNGGKPPTAGQWTAPVFGQATSGMNDPLTGQPYTGAGLAAPGGAQSAGILYTLGTGLPGNLACDGNSILSARNVKLQMSSESGSTLCVDDH